MAKPSFRSLGIALLLFSLGLAGQPPGAVADVRINTDEPVYGRWDFAPRLLWQVAELQGQAFAIPAELRVSADGTLFLRDFSKNLSFVMDADGGFVGTVAPPGENPGEVSRYVNCFPTPGQVAISSMDALHFFDRQGHFIAAFPNNIFTSFPGVFLTDREFLASTGPVFMRESGVMEIRRIKLDGNQSEVFTEVSTEGAMEPPPPNLAINLRGVTPHIEMAFDQKRGLVYIGRSDRYAIQVFDLAGKLKLTFGINRKPVPIEPEVKKAQFADLELPPGQIQGLVDGLPDVLTYYRRIQVTGDFVFVTTTTDIDRQPTQVQIDIFSRDGEYLYRAPLTFAGDEHIFGNAENLVIHQSSFYVSMENSEGERYVARYQIRLPGRR
jgi:hypothetical protein